MSNFDIFDQFPKISAKQWKQKIQFELKGEDYNKRCIWQSVEEIAINPSYKKPQLLCVFFRSESPNYLFLFQKI